MLVGSSHSSVENGLSVDSCKHTLKKDLRQKRSYHTKILTTLSKDSLTLNALICFRVADLMS